MKRYLFIPAMIPVMLILWKLVLSADRLYQWKYSEEFAPPTESDHNFAAFAFFTALLTPVIIGLTAAIVSYYKKYQPCWPIIETVITAFTYIIFTIGFAIFPSKLAGIGIIGAYYITGGVIVAVQINTAACVRQRKWGKFANSVIVLIGGMLYLFVISASIIYVDA